jgi:DNA invertase Pin-like site-specific DNA recombinase
VEVIVVYKVDRLTRSLADFAKLVEIFDEHGVSFVSITQSFNTTSSMARLTLTDAGAHAIDVEFKRWHRSGRRKAETEPWQNLEGLL